MHYDAVGIFNTTVLRAQAQLFAPAGTNLAQNAIRLIRHDFMAKGECVYFARKAQAAWKKVLGNLLKHKAKTAREMIRERGGNEQTFERPDPGQMRPSKSARAVVDGDETAKKAIKIVKEAKRLGEKH